MAIISLRADGFDLTIESRAASQFPGSARFRGTLSLTPTIPGVQASLHTDADFPLSDFERLCDWVDVHIRNVLRDSGGVLPKTAGVTWVSLDLSIEVRLMSGEIERDGGSLSGSFAILVLLRVGTSPASGTHVYGGFQGEVEVNEALSFCQALRDWPDKLAAHQTD
jgi:hypothetical protein